MKQCDTKRMAKIIITPTSNSTATTMMKHLIVLILILNINTVKSGRPKTQTRLKSMK